MNIQSKFFIMFFIFILSFSIFYAQDKGVFVEKNNKFFSEVRKELDKFNNPVKEPRKSFSVDFDGMELPTSKEQFTYAWHTKPHSQGWTGTCWSHAATSFFESEVYRLSKKEVRISEMYTVYWEYVEKAKGFVHSRGKSKFAEGSEGNAVAKIWRKYGAVPFEAYTGLKPGLKYPDHRKLFSEMMDYLQSVKKTSAWNEEEVVSTIKSILNNYLGTPPKIVTVDGKEYTPKQYLDEYLQLNLDDYYDILSYMQKPYFQMVEYQVPDNWWHSEEYFNVPLDDFMKTLKKAVRKGYTVSIGGDVSEPGIDGEHEVAIIPSFDIPSDYIDENARQFRFSNRTTTDDHGIHLIGFMEKDGKDWYLIKDSGSRSFNGANQGYFFYNEDYVKLKMMDFMVHKDIAEELLQKMK